MVKQSCVMAMGWSLWRGSLLPLGCEAAPNPAKAFLQENSISLFCDCFAVEREQAPSPQRSPHGPVFKKSGGLTHRRFSERIRALAARVVRTEHCARLREQAQQRQVHHRGQAQG